MLTIKKISGSYTAAAYYAEYAKGKGEVQGTWLDDHQSLVTNGSAVDSEEMLNLLRGYSPDGKIALCQNSGKNHQPGWDLTFSPPKSVSIAWSNADIHLREQIEASHKDAVVKALRFLNKEAGKVRTGKQGKIMTDARFVAALFQHSSNRAEEPQLHTHAIVFNLAKSTRDQKWRTLHPYPIYRAYMAAGALYKAELAHKMRSLGLETRRTKDSFELAKIPNSICEAQSSRSKAIEESLAHHGLQRHEASAAMREFFSFQSRKGKGNEKIIRDFARWQKENAIYGFGPEDQRIALLTKKEHRISTQFRGSFGDDEINKSLDQLTTHQSTFNKYDLYRSLAEAAIGEVGADAVLTSAQNSLESSNIIILGPNQRHETRYSTPEMVKIEEENSLGVAARRGEDRHPVPESIIQQVLTERPTIKDEQAKALKHIISGSDGVTFIEGDAGTGKSYMMDAVRDAYERCGYHVRGVSFTNKAAKNLESGSGIKDCQSIDSLLLQKQKGENPLHAKTILILDEAGMVGSRKMKSILDYCKTSGAKLVCVGDQKQIQPIAAGQAFGALKKAFGAERLSEIMRQKEEWLKQAIIDFAEGRTRSGIEALESRKSLNILKNRSDSRREVITTWSSEVEKNGMEKAPLIVATKNREVEILNGLAREELVKKGLIDHGSPLSTESGRHNYAPGDRIVFTSNFKKKGIYNSTVATIEKIKYASKSGKSATLSVKTEGGRRLRFELDTFNHFRHAYAITAHKSQGSTVDQVLVVVDGTLMDREKFYVAISRGRENPKVFVDQETLGGMAFDERMSISSLAEEEKAQEEREFFKKSLVRILGTSHEKDTSQDYLGSHRGLHQGMSNQIGNKFDFLRKIEEMKAAISMNLQRFEEKISDALRKLSIHDKSPKNAEKSKDRSDVAHKTEKNKGQGYEL